MAVDAGLRAPRADAMQVNLPHDRLRQSQAAGRSIAMQENVRAIRPCRGAAPFERKPAAEGRRGAPRVHRRPAHVNRPGARAAWVGVLPTFGVPIVKDAHSCRRRTPRTGKRRSSAVPWRSGSGGRGSDRQARVGHPASRAQRQTIVGVAGDVVGCGLGEEPILHIYVPFAEERWTERRRCSPPSFRRMACAMTEGGYRRCRRSMRGAIARIDPARWRWPTITTMSQVMADAAAPQRFQLWPCSARS